MEDDSLQYIRTYPQSQHLQLQQLLLTLARKQPGKNKEMVYYIANNPAS